MLVFHLGTDPYEQPPGEYEILVTDYSCGSYEGDGYALVLRPSGVVEWSNLGHCSCYGPFENYSPCQTWDTVAQFKESVSGVDKHLEQKFMELVEELQDRHTEAV